MGSLVLNPCIPVLPCKLLECLWRLPSHAQNSISASIGLVGRDLCIDRGEEVRHRRIEEVQFLACELLCRKADMLDLAIKNLGQYVGHLVKVRVRIMLPSGSLWYTHIIITQILASGNDIVTIVRLRIRQSPERHCCDIVGRDEWLEPVAGCRINCIFGLDRATMMLSTFDKVF